MENLIKCSLSTAALCFQCFNVSVVQVKLGFGFVLSSKRIDMKCNESWLNIEHRKGRVTQSMEESEAYTGCLCLFVLRGGRSSSEVSLEG